MSFGRPYIMKTTGCIHDGWLVLKPSGIRLFETDFLYYLLSSPFVFNQFNSKAAGSTVRNLNISLVSSVVIPIPPLPEQQRIVSILDKCFEAIDKAKSNAERNLQNAKELFESYLNKVFENKDEAWKPTTLLELCDEKGDIVGGPFGSNLKVEHYLDNGVPILRLQNIGKGYFINKHIKYISEEKASELAYHSFKSGDIALAKLGIPIGKTCIIPDDFPQGIVVADVVRIRPSKKKVDYHFLTYFLNSSLSVSQLTGNISGATRPRVNIVDVRSIQISVPSLKIQKSVVENLKTLQLKTEQIKAQYNQKINDLEELRKSILQKAFSGELKIENIDI
jgi:type I restriction enzyme S subunit